MMLVNTEYNDQNINRACTKMSENFTSQKGNAKLSNTNQDVAYFDNLNSGDIVDNINLAYDHIYATNKAKNGVNNTENNCQNAESEVRFLKEWLLIHLDLIQQQNDDILSKEKTIFLLQQENEMLKERIRCMEKGAPYQPSNCSNLKSPNSVNRSIVKDMTQDSGPVEEDNKEKVTLDLEHLQTNCDSIELEKYQAKHEDDDRAAVIEENHLTSITPQALNSTVISEEGNSSVSLHLNNSASVSEDSVLYNNVKYTIEESAGTDLDSMKNLRMNIRRKRVCSNSSAFSNPESTGLDDKRNCKRMRKKRKRIVKDEEVLTIDDPFHTHAGDIFLIPPTEQELAAEAAALTSTTLEVPHWRVKVYASCYSMEGTENLEDAVYSRRHSRLEVDERRRKRWDVQRIREQRIVEKLKQRQERGARTGDLSDPVQSLWPTLDDIKYVEVNAQLPVSSLGSPLPKYNLSEFTIPWISNPPIPAKKIKRLRKRKKGMNKR